MCVDHSQIEPILTCIVSVSEKMTSTEASGGLQGWTGPMNRQLGAHLTILIHRFGDSWPDCR